MEKDILQEINIGTQTKRFIDILVSSCGLFLLSPLLCLIIFAIKLTSAGPVIFVQQRVGINGRLFSLYKFRTMHREAERITLGKYITKDSDSLTAVGRFLRRWALDELPQLVNVLKGDMSIVGPRPTLQYQVEKYNERQRLRLLMKPGITGWAQVNGRNALSWPMRIELDVWYIENWSLRLDTKIILMTLPTLLRRDFAFHKENVGDDVIVRIEE